MIVANTFLYTPVLAQELSTNQPVDFVSTENRNIRESVYIQNFVYSSVYHKNLLLSVIIIFLYN